MQSFFEIPPKSLDNPSTAIFLFNGFPGLFSRNMDLAAHLAAKLQTRVFVFLSPGIPPRPGDFSFQNCIVSAEQTLQQCISTYNLQRIHFIGHSWGGYVSCLMAQRFPQLTDRILLLAPFLKVPPYERLRPLVEGVAKLCNQLEGYSFNLQAIKTEVDNMHRQAISRNPLEIALTHAQKVLLIHGSNDTVTPIARSDEAVLAMQRQQHLVDDHLTYERTDDEHRFYQRERLITRAKVFFK